jgi:hypothetical protein
LQHHRGRPVASSRPAGSSIIEAGR